mgnify:CR=1 FL=1
MLMLTAQEDGVKDNAAAQAIRLLRNQPGLAVQIAENLPHMIGENRITLQDALKKLEEALKENASFSAQNDAIREENERLRKIYNEAAEELHEARLARIPEILAPEGKLIKDDDGRDFIEFNYLTVVNRLGRTYSICIA